MNRSRWSLIVFILILGSCSSTTNSRRGMLPPLNGMVYDHESQPVQGALIQVDGTVNARSDVNGRFVLVDLPMEEHSLTISRAGFETIQTTFEYSDVTQVIYVKMISSDQLLMQAEAALDRKNWQEAENLLNRNETVQGNNPAASYLRAVFDFKRGEYTAAKNRLEALLADGLKDPFIHLFLADLYQYHLDDQNRAAEYLSNYLMFRFDPDIEKRLLTIKNIP